ncbi:MAG: hypothetical protein MZV63_36225 [Marinilabiliales bacterium]|nr:hypothetical protein [Marinilabiliales bacterium]
MALISPHCDALRLGFLDDICLVHNLVSARCDNSQLLHDRFLLRGARHSCRHLAPEVLHAQHCRRLLHVVWTLKRIFLVHVITKRFLQKHTRPRLLILAKLVDCVTRGEDRNLKLLQFLGNIWLSRESKATKSA